MADAPRAVASQVFLVRQPPAQRLVVLVVVKVPKPLESAQSPSPPTPNTQGASSGILAPSVPPKTKPEVLKIAVEEPVANIGPIAAAEGKAAVDAKVDIPGPIEAASGLSAELTGAAFVTIGRKVLAANAGPPEGSVPRTPT